MVALIFIRETRDLNLEELDQEEDSRAAAAKAKASGNLTAYLEARQPGLQARLFRACIIRASDLGQFPDWCSRTVR
jgi:hypothetical protein